MSSKFRNVFLVFGVLVVVIMLFSFDMKYDELWNNLKRAGGYLPLVLLLWLVIYFINALSWFVIIRGGKPSPVSFFFGLMICSFEFLFCFENHCFISAILSFALLALGFLLTSSSLATITLLFTAFRGEIMFP